MKVTPLDLRQQQFKTVMRGYDRGEVQAFLLEASDDYENALRENDKLRTDVARLDAMLAEHRGQERNLRNTLLTAQKHADDIKEHAQTEANLIVRDAEGQRDLILQKAQARVDEVQREIDQMRHKRREVENDLEALIRTLTSTLEFVRDQDARFREERVLELVLDPLLVDCVLVHARTPGPFAELSFRPLSPLYDPEPIRGRTDEAGRCRRCTASR